MWSSEMVRHSWVSFDINLATSKASTPIDAGGAVALAAGRWEWRFHRLPPTRRSHVSDTIFFLFNQLDQNLVKLIDLKIMSFFSL